MPNVASEFPKSGKVGTVQGHRDEADANATCFAAMCTASMKKSRDQERFTRSGGASMGHA
jgi:hypothetical protein